MSQEDLKAQIAEANKKNGVPILERSSFYKDAEKGGDMDERKFLPRILWQMFLM